MHRKRIQKQIAAVLAAVPLFLMSGCSGEQGYVLDGLQQAETDAKLLSEQSAGETSNPEPAADSKSAAEPESAGETVDTPPAAGYVYVCGAVVDPGVYPMQDGMRLFEAIEAAGGFSEEADDSWLNLAGEVSDGQRIYVYTREETAEMALEGTAADGASDGTLNSTSDSDGDPADIRININTADAQRLMELPGIGEARAAAVIQYRTEHGPFTSIEEIQNISGIKGAVFSKIRDLITV
jgi:competence protein ComEA